jgi:hypothetical protein
MKYLGWAIGLLLTFAILFVGAEKLASERVEVVELHTLDMNNELVTTRLWVVDDEGFQYLRVGSDGSGWFTRLQDSESFQMTRNGQTHTYFAVPRIEKSDRINQLMQEKYTWGDTLIALMVGSREKSIPIEMHSVTSRQ